MADNRTVGIEAGATRFRIKTPTDEIDRLLYEELAYRVDGAEWSEAYSNGAWDGYQRLYNRRDHAASIGLLDRARTVLDREGYDVTVTDNRQSSGNPIATKWQFAHTLRDYQREAVSAVLDSGGGVVSLPTGAGKTVVALRLIHSVGRRAIVFVHSKELLYQWADEVREVLDVDPGVIGDGEWSEGPVTVALMDTLVSRGPEKLDEYDVAVYDECHRTSAADTFHAVGQAVDAPLRVGLSATPWRKVSGEELKIEGATGGTAFEVSAEELIESGHLARPKWRVVDPAEHGTQQTPNPDEVFQQAYKRCVVKCEARNRSIAEAATDLARDGRSVLVTVDRIAHGERLQSIIGSEYTVPAVFLDGSAGGDRRKAVLEDHGSGDVLVSTLIREVVDLPELDAVVLAGGGKSKVDVIQQIGRTLRPDGCETAVIVDVRDRGEYIGDHFEARREYVSDYYGEYGPNLNCDPAVETVREWLERNGIPTDQVSVSSASNGGVRVEITGWVEEFDHYRELMQAAGASFDGEANYIHDLDRLPEVA
jgi:superfamily II DNA or RNA helicase